MKKALLLFILSLILFTSPGKVILSDSAAERPLEIKYPNLPTDIVSPPTTVDTGLPEYVRYVYYLIIAISGFFVVGALVYGGFRYLTSVGNPEATKDAKEQILAALIGGLILLGSWLILHTINPKLVDLNVSPIIPVVPPQFTGILLCVKDVNVSGYYAKRKQAEDLTKQFKESKSPQQQKSLAEEIKKIVTELDKMYQEIKKQCYLVPGKGDVPSEWKGKITKNGGIVYFITEEITIRVGEETKKTTKGYGLILTEKGMTFDTNQWIELESGKEVGVWYSWIKLNRVDTIIPYIYMKDEEIPNRKVIVYEEVNYNRGVEKKQTQEFEGSAKRTWQELNFSPRSLNIGNEEKTIVVLTTEEKEAGIVKNGYFFTQDDPNLLKYYWITDHLKCPIESIKRGGCPAAKKIAISYGQIY